jgi:hypothetical protein
VLQTGSNSAEELHAVEYSGSYTNLNYDSLLGGQTPAQSGTVSTIGNPGGEEADFTDPLHFSGMSGPAGTTMEHNVVVYRFYLIPATAGTYKLDLTLVDDTLVVWVGASAQSGFSTAAAATGALYSTGGSGAAFTTISVGLLDIGKAIPIRILWGNDNGAAAFTGTLTDPLGNTLLGQDTVKNPQIVTSCDADFGQAPKWPPFQDEP